MMTNLLAEKAVLGSILLAGEMLDVGTLEPKHFSDRRNQLVFQGMDKLDKENKEIDVVMLSQVVPNDGRIFDYLIELVSEVPTAENIKKYVDIVRNNYNERQLAIACDSYLQNRDSDSIGLITESLEKITSIVSDNANSVRQSLTNILTSLDKEAEEGIHTFNSFDAMLGGLCSERLNIIAARPAVGKTALALNIMSEACKQGAAVEFFSLEMSDKELLGRVISSEIMTNSMKWQNPKGLMSEGEKQAVVEAVGTIDTWDLNIYESGIDIRFIKEKAKLLMINRPMKKRLIIIDYLQLLPRSDRKSTNDAVGEITRELKMIAKEFKVSVLLLSQLSRGVEQRQDKRPQLSDLRDSGNIEQDADSVTFIYRDDYYDQSDDSEPNNIIELLIRKNRHGSTGMAELLFIKEYQKMTNLSHRTGE